MWLWEFSQMPKRWEIVKSVTCPNEGKDRFGSEFYSAFTCAELGEMLPDEFSDKPYHYYNLRIKRINKKWSVCYDGINPNGRGHTIKEYIDDTEANTRAKMVIYLKENK